MKKILIAICFLIASQTLKAQSESETLEWLNSKVPSLMYSEEYGARIKFTGAEIQIPTGYVKDDKVKYTHLYILQPSTIKSVLAKAGENNSVHLQIAAGNIRHYENYDDDPATFSSTNSATVYLSAISSAETEKIIKAIKHLAVLKGAKLINDDLF